MQKGEKGTAEDQLAEHSQDRGPAGRLIEKRYSLVITHGNGPQVGNIMIQNEAGRDRRAQMPMDICGAQSQG